MEMFRYNLRSINQAIEFLSADHNKDFGFAVYVLQQKKDELQAFMAAPNLEIEKELEEEVEPKKKKECKKRCKKRRCVRKKYGYPILLMLIIVHEMPFLERNACQSIFWRTKLGHGLLSGKYSIPATKNDAGTGDAIQEGIPPRMFKNVIAASHAEFSSMEQQDALEFFLHLLDKVEHVGNTTPDLDPSRSFKFGIEEKILCPSGKVAYNKRVDCILSLHIPLHEATNKDELEAFNKQKAGKGLEENDKSSDEIVRPRVPLQACLANFASSEPIDYYSSALKGKTTAIKTTGLTSFPDYLVLNMKKYVMEAGGVPKKLDVYIDVPDVIDISHMRSKGLQPGEELLPDGDSSNSAQTPAESGNS